MVVIEHAELRGIALRVFEAAGSEPEEARIMADHLIEANLRGHDSHGVGLTASAPGARSLRAKRR